MRMETKTGTCPVCTHETTLALRERFHAYTLWECRACAVQFWDPFRNPGADWYKNDERYHTRHTASADTNPLVSLGVNHQEFFRDVPVPNGRLLDIGTGTGHFLAYARRRGYEIYGLDFDEKVIDAAKDLFSITTLYALSLEEFMERFPGLVFDVATFFEVLEHLDNPAGFLGNVKRLLRSRGYIALSVPYRGAWEGFKEHDKPPRHLTRWDEDSLRGLLDRNGFDVVSLRRIPAPFERFLMKFHFWFKGFLSFGLVEKVAMRAPRHEAPEGRRLVRARISIIRFLAKAKTYLLFGIPAGILYAALALTKKRYTGMYCLARARG